MCFFLIGVVLVSGDILFWCFMYVFRFWIWICLFPFFVLWCFWFVHGEFRCVVALGWDGWLIFDVESLSNCLLFCMCFL